MLERIGISLEDDLLRQFDRLIAEKGYANRSEAVRDLIRAELVQRAWAEAKGREERVVVVTLVYDHDSSSLAQKLTRIQHENHLAVVSSLHVHMDAHNCLEVIIVRGVSSKVKLIANTLLSTRGVKHGQLVSTSTGRTLS